MARGKANGLSAWVWVVGIIVLALIALLLALNPPQPPLYGVIRVAALLGYVCVFLASLSSAYMRELTRVIGRPFIKVHHTLSIAGLALLTIHPIAAAWFSQSLAVFVPEVSSWKAFFELGGRPAWYLFVIVVVTAALRRQMKRSWHSLHYLTYIAFWLGTVHAILIGSDVQYVSVRIIAILMGLAVVFVLVRKRFAARQRRSLRRGSG